MNKLNLILLNKNRIKIKMRYFVMLFISMILLSVVPYVNSFIANFSYSEIQEDSNYQELDIDEVIKKLSEYTIDDGKLLGPSEFDFSSDSYSFKYLGVDYDGTNYFSDYGFTLYKNCLIYNGSEKQGINYIFRYPKKVDLSEYFATTEESGDEKLLSLFFDLSRLVNIGFIVFNLVTIILVSRSLLFAGYVFFPLLMKFLPKFRKINLANSFKITTWSISITTPAFFIATFLFKNVEIVDIVYIYLSSLLVILNVLNLYIANTKDKKRRLDNKQYL